MAPSAAAQEKLLLRRSKDFTKDSGEDIISMNLKATSPRSQKYEPRSASILTPGG